MPVPNPKPFPDQLRAHMDRLGWTLPETAKVLDIGERTLWAWLKNDPRRQPHSLTQEGALKRLRKQPTSEPPIGAFIPTLGKRTALAGNSKAIPKARAS